LFIDPVVMSAPETKDPGAKGDGSTDDTVILNSVLSYAANLSSVVYFPFGVYMIQDTLKALTSSY
jgi:polygalacturonase